jgi:hypothetical protein
MMRAIYSKTATGARMRIKEALENARNVGHQKAYNYIMKEWYKTSDLELGRKCLYSRDHSRTLLQVKSTNALESYHKVLKHEPQFSLKSAGFLASVKQVLKTNYKIVEKNKKASMYRSMRVFGDLRDNYPLMCKLPVEMQELVLSEYNKVEDRIMRGKQAPELLQPWCHCDFFHMYNLPCKHIFHADVCGTKLLTDEYIQRNILDVFEENGFDVYHDYESYTVVGEQTQDDQRIRQVVEFKAILESALHHFYKMSDRPQNTLNNDDIQAFIDSTKRFFDRLCIV